MPNPSLARLAFAGVATAALASPAIGRDVRAGSLRLTAAWSRPAPPGAPAGAGYLTITNRGSRPDRLVGGSSSVVERVEVHEMKIDDGVMRMRPVAGGLVIPAGGTVQLAPGGYHIMLIGLKRRVATGGVLPVTLRFQRAGAVAVNFDVRATPPATGAGR